MSNFSIGDQVIYTSGNWGSENNNPLHNDYPNVTGKVVGTGPMISVKWSNGESNCYDSQDLEQTNKFMKHKMSLNI